MRAQGRRVTLYRRKWEENFGPTDFSFNRGDVHYVCINNCFFHRGMSYYSPGELRERQVKWLKQDLALTPKDDAGRSTRPVLYGITGYMAFRGNGA